MKEWCFLQAEVPGQDKMGQHSLSREQTVTTRPIQPQTQKPQVDTVQIKTGKLSISAQLYNRQSSLLPQSLDYKPSLYPSPPSALFLPFQVFSVTNILN